MKTHHSITLISLGFAIVALVLHIVCMATPYYVTLDMPQIYIGFGLFMMCTDVKDTALEDKGCEANGDQSGDWLKASQAVSIVGAVLLAIGTLLLLLHVFKTSQGDRKRLLPRFVRALFGIGAIFILVGDALVFKKFYHPVLEDYSMEARVALEESKFSWGFYTDIVAGVLALLAGICQAAAIRLSLSEESGIV